MARSGESIQDLISRDRKYVLGSMSEQLNLVVAPGDIVASLCWFLQQLPGSLHAGVATSLWLVDLSCLVANHQKRIIYALMRHCVFVVSSCQPPCLCRQVELTDAFDDAPKAAAPSTAAAVAGSEVTSSSSASSSPSSRPRQQGPKTRKQRQADMAQAADAARSGASKSSTSTQVTYKRCKDAIDAGLAAFQARDYMGAIDLFNMALELPGNGMLASFYHGLFAYLSWAM